MLIEWPKDEAQPIKYWLSTLPAEISLTEFVRLAKHRWIIERDYEELKQELAWVTLKGVTGGASTITPPCASRPMGSW